MDSTTAPTAPADVTISTGAASSESAPVASATQAAMYAKLKLAGVVYKTSADYLLNHPAC